MKTDRRDALSLARLHRAGELTAVWVPGPEQEVLRDLTRAREDMTSTEVVCTLTSPRLASPSSEGNYCACST